MAVAMLALTLPPAYVSGIIVASVLSRKAWSKLLVHAELHPTCIHETFAQIETARSDANGHGIGAVATQPQFEKVLHFIDPATSEGAMWSQGTVADEGLGGGRFDRHFSGGLASNISSSCLNDDNQKARYHGATRTRVEEASA